MIIIITIGGNYKLLYTSANILWADYKFTAMGKIPMWEGRK